MLKKDLNWEWTHGLSFAYRYLKEVVTDIPYRAHDQADYKYIVIPDASKRGLGATVWREQPGCIL